MRPQAWLRSSYRRVRRLLGRPPAIATPRAPEPQSPDEALPAYLAERLAARAVLYPAVARPQKISFLTSAFDTPPEFLDALARTVLEQDAPDAFEWILLDNGSTRDDTRAALAALAHDPRVRYARVEANLGIIGGMRHCLLAAGGDYVAPLDSDDVITPDCVRVLTAFLQIHGHPALVYTDEDKLDGNRHFQGYAKPDWDPVLFSRSCFIAHLTLLRRDVALAVGCYDDPRTEGSHDWDSFVRFLRAGHRPVHCPEFLYSWRLHGASTTADYNTKPYVFDSQRTVLEKFSEAHARRYRYAVVADPLFRGAPDWRHQPIDLPHELPIAPITLATSLTIASLQQQVSALPDTADLVHLIDAGCTPDDTLWLEEAVSLLDLHADAVMIGGRIHDGAAILNGASVFGFGEPVFCPDKGRPLGDPGYFAQAWKAHSAAAVSPRHAVVARAFLRDALADLPPQATVRHLGVWLGAAARAAGKRVIYSPHLDARAADDWDATIPVAERQALVGRYGDVMSDRVGYGTALQRLPGRAFMPGFDDRPAERPRYPEWLAQRIATRGRGRGAPATAARISLFTTVYERTDAVLFRELAASIAAQTERPREWLVLAHGPVDPALDGVLRDLERAGAAIVHRLADNRGIAGGSRYCLEHAQGDWVWPIDADDLITPDALALIADAIATSARPVTILYTDEDVLADGVLKDPFCRPDFDPVLLTGQSYVNHAIVFDRALGLALGLYAEDGATFALDWEILQLFWQAGHAAAHLPEVVYHWRKHTASISQSGAQVFDGTVRSVRHILDRFRHRAVQPERYEVAPCPIDLGIGDLHLARKPIAPPPIAMIRLGGTDATVDPAATPLGVAHCRALALDPGNDPIDTLLTTLTQATEAMVLVVGPGVLLHAADGVWDAVKFLELYDDALAVSGRLVDADGQVLVGCPVAMPSGRLIDPAAGQSTDLPGYYSLGLKPHTISVPCLDLLLVRREPLIAALCARSPRVSLRHLGAWIGRHAAATGQRIIYAPLLRGAVADPTRLLGDRGAHLATAWAWMGEMVDAPVSPRLGLGPTWQSRLLFD